MAFWLIHLFLLLNFTLICLTGVLGKRDRASGQPASLLTFASSSDTSLANLVKASNQRHKRSDIDLRAHRLFDDESAFDCCPTITEVNHRTVGINWNGEIVQLLHTENFTQTFYESKCAPLTKDAPCQFIEKSYADFSTCIQQYHYVYVLARPILERKENYRVDYIRLATGCKCRLSGLNRKRKFNFFT